MISEFKASLVHRVRKKKKKRKKKEGGRKGGRERLEKERKQSK